MFENPNQEKEIELWKQFKEGSKSAFKIIFDKYSPILYHYGLSYLGKEEFIEDCIHELFLNLWKSKSSLADVNSIKYYLIVSFRRSVSKQQFLISKRQKVNGDFYQFETEKEDLSSQELLISDQSNSKNNKLLDTALQKLPEKQHQAVRLRFYENKEYTEIMEEMSISYQTARKFVYLGVKKLRSNLDHDSFL